jgi:hypothetical protein
MSMTAWDFRGTLDYVIYIYYIYFFEAIKKIQQIIDGTD